LNPKNAIFLVPREAFGTMELQKKIKTALDETRLLVLGSQILLGFQFRSVFEQTFEQVPETSRHFDGVAIMLMVVAIALLIAPSMHHRILNRGEDMPQTNRVLTVLASCALLPFAASLGLDVFIAMEQLGGWWLGFISGVSFLLLALFWWYGFGAIRRRTIGHREREMTEKQNTRPQKTPLHAKVEQALTEARIIIPGAQALLGFQLAIVMTPSFQKIPDASRIIHALSLGLTALTVILLMAPAAYHRIVYAGEDSQEFHRTAGILVTTATVPLVLGLAGDVYVVIAKIFGSNLLAIIAASGAFVVCASLWYLYPLLRLHLADSRAQFD
jgi:uncharacterized protein DUF6328